MLLVMQQPSFTFRWRVEQLVGKRDGISVLALVGSCFRGMRLKVCAARSSPRWLSFQHWALFAPTGEFQQQVSRQLSERPTGAEDIGKNRTWQ